MITIRKSEERGHFDHGWLDTYHTFSFADYHDPQWTGFRSLLVMNEDVVQPGEGFPPHQHRDMEIITYIIEGALRHKDSMGNSSIIRRGEIQRMTAGTGVTHSEYNASGKEPVHLLQIWLVPERKSLQPGYEQIQVKPGEGSLVAIVSREKKPGTVLIHQDAEVFLGLLKKGQRVGHQIKKDRGAWVQLVKGRMMLNGTLMHAGDGAAVEDENRVEIEAKDDAELLVFDLA